MKYQVIAYCFGISQSGVSKNFKKWVNIMYIYLKPFIVWRGHEEVLKIMSDGFKTEFNRCICIDCFEVFCGHTSDLMARTQTYSKYKHHNTVKYLSPLHLRESYPLCLKVGEVEYHLTSISLKTVACLAIFNQVTKC